MDELQNVITLEEFEKNGAKYNKKHITRSYFDVLKHLDEYEGAYESNFNDFETLLFQVQVDKDVVEDLISYFHNHGYQIYRNKELPYIENLIVRLTKNIEKNKNEIEKLSAVLNSTENKIKYNVIENDDAVFYLRINNNKTHTIYDFIKAHKNNIIKFAKDNDLTILFRTDERRGRLVGFCAFNFFDNVDDEVKEFEFANRFEYKVASNTKTVFIEECLNLNSIAKNKFELKELNVFITKNV